MNWKDLQTGSILYINGFMRAVVWRCTDEDMEEYWMALIDTKTYTAFKFPSIHSAKTFVELKLI